MRVSTVDMHERYMKRREVSGMTAVPLAASEQSSEPDGPDLRSGLFNLNIAGMVLEA